jgi:hypothetical protein
MSNLRILYDNLADTALSLAADSTAGALVAANLLTETKAEVHRSTALTVRYTLTWATTQAFNMAALAFTNFSSAATMRARVYPNSTDVPDTDPPTVDSGAVLCCGYQPFGLWDWGMLPLGVNAFSYGGFAYGRVYFPPANGLKLVIDVDDSLSSASYLEAARLITGAYWSPEFNAVHTPQLTPDSNTQHRRNDAGDLRTERRPVSRTLRLDLAALRSAADRLAVYNLLRGNGMTKPVFVSLFPQHSDPSLEQMHQIWGKLNDSAMTHPSLGMFAAALQIEEI